MCWQLITSSVLYLSFATVNVVRGGGTLSNRELITHILTNVSLPPLRPVDKPSDQLLVYVTSALYQVVDMDQRTNLATVSAYFETTWKDVHISWDPARFNATFTYVPADRIWLPEFYLYHSVQGSTPMVMSDAAVQIDYEGNIRAFIPFTAQAFCPINVKHFPFDTQTCHFKFGSWSYMSSALQYEVKDTRVYLGDFFDNQEWLLTSSSLHDFMLMYPSEKYGNESYSLVVMTLQLQRQSFYYVFNLTSVVAVCGFHAKVSCESRRTAKFRLGIMTLLSMGVMLLMVVDDMPKFALASIPGQRGSYSDVPLLGMLYIGLISLISVSTCAVQLFVVLEAYALRHPRLHHMPYLFRLLLPAEQKSAASESNISNAAVNGRKTIYQPSDPDDIGSAAMLTTCNSLVTGTGGGGETCELLPSHYETSSPGAASAEQQLMNGPSPLALRGSNVPSVPPKLAPVAQPEDISGTTPRTNQPVSARPTTGNTAACCDLNHNHHHHHSQHKQQQHQQAVLDGLIVDLQASLRTIGRAVDRVSTELSGATCNLLAAQLQPHWECVIWRLECVSLAFFLGMILLFLSLFYLGPTIY